MGVPLNMTGNAHLSIYRGLSLSAIILFHFTKLLRRNTVVCFKAFYHMTAIGKACFLADICEIKIGECKEFLDLVNAHILHVFLAGLAVNGEKFFCKI